MTHRISNEEFESVAKQLFRKLGDWSGEGLNTSNLDDKTKKGMQARVDTGKMAALKRGLRSQGSPVASVAWVIEPCIPVSWAAESGEYIALYQAALLYTFHPHQMRRSPDGHWDTSLPRSFSLANGDRRGSSSEDYAANDRRINRILDARHNELFPRLTQSFRALMNGTDQDVDWVQLACDIRDWNQPDQIVQQRWARAWYGGPKWLRPETPDNEGPDTTVPELVAS